MDEKYDPEYERKIKDLANLRLHHENYKVFDHDARIVKRVNIPKTKETGKSDYESCLVIINRDGECIVITREFEKILRNAVEKC